MLSDPLKKEARITRIIRDVNLLSSDVPPRAAAENDEVNENNLVQTGAESRTELTFDDLTITRLGANTIFSFNKAGHSGQLGGGSILVYVPKNSGGGEFKTSAVSVGITGTTLIFESTRVGDGRVIVLEGGVQLGLINEPREIRNMRAGQMLELKAGATKLPAPVDVDLDQIMKTHPLITDFSPLPSQDLILAVIKGQRAPASGRPPPSSRGTPFIPTGPPPPRRPGILIPTPPPQPTFAPPLTGYTPPPSPRCWCCVNGQVFQTTAADCRQRNGQCYDSRKEALNNCKRIDNSCWCCIDGQVFRTTAAYCQERGGQCYRSQEQARKHCGGGGTSPSSCWCCADGQVFQSTAADCTERGGQCYDSRKAANRNCRGRMQPPPPPRGPGMPTPTPTRPPIGKGPSPRPIKPPTKATPTPTPSQIF